MVACACMHAIASMAHAFFYIFFNTRFALGAPLLYVDLVYFLRGGNSSFRGLGQYDTPLDAARSQTEDGRKKFVQSRIFR